MIYTHAAGMVPGRKSALDIAACLPAALCNNPVGSATSAIYEGVSWFFKP